MIDWDRIRTLRDEVGEEDFPDIVEIFIEEVSEMIETLRSTTTPETCGDDLHALKGSALNLGFTAFSDLCQAGETYAAHGKHDEIQIGPIIACYDASKDLFLAGLKGGRAA